MKSRKALRFIERKIQEGYSKKEIYSELFGKVPFRTDLLQLLAMVPEMEVREKYRVLNLLLFALIIFVVGLRVVLASHLVLNSSLYMAPFVALYALVGTFFAFMVWNFRGFVYRIIGFLGIAGLLKILFELVSPESYSMVGLAAEIILNILPIALIVIIAFYIGLKAFPYYGFWGMLQEKKLNL